MKSLLLLPPLGVLLAFGGCAGGASRPTPSYFIDVHEFGPGKVTAEAVAQAHRSDLAVQHKHGVRFVEYWVDEDRGSVYCLSEAPNPEAVVATHREAHGLLPASVARVSKGN